MIKNFKAFALSLRRDPFRLQVNLNLDDNLKIFLENFPKFDYKYSAFVIRKKEKNKLNREQGRRNHKRNLP